MMKVETFEAIGVANLRTARKLAKHSPSMPSFTMEKWPNELGEQPKEAIGKTVILSMDGKDEKHIIDSAADDGRLFLRPLTP